MTTLTRGDWNYVAAMATRESERLSSEYNDSPEFAEARQSIGRIYNHAVDNGGDWDDNLKEVWEFTYDLPNGELSIVGEGTDIDEARLDAEDKSSFNLLGVDCTHQLRIGSQKVPL